MLLKKLNYQNPLIRKRKLKNRRKNNIKRRPKKKMMIRISMSMKKILKKERKKERSEENQKKKKINWKMKKNPNLMISKLTRMNKMNWNYNSNYWIMKTMKYSIRNFKMMIKMKKKKKFKKVMMRITKNQKTNK